MPALVTFGAVLAVIFGVRYFGLWQGQQHAPASSTASAQVAAVIVDPTALNKATAALEAHRGNEQDDFRRRRDEPPERSPGG
jgi:hypothetical protein